MSRILSLTRLLLRPPLEGSLIMMEEKISALHPTAHLFGLTDAELGRYVGLARFSGAQELVRRGHKSLAAKHGLPNLT